MLVSFVPSLLTRGDVSLRPGPGLRQVTGPWAGRQFPAWTITLLPFLPLGLVPDPLASPPGVISSVPESAV